MVRDNVSVFADHESGTGSSLAPISYVQLNDGRLRLSSQISDAGQDGCAQPCSGLWFCDHGGRYRGGLRRGRVRGGQVSHGAADAARHETDDGNTGDSAGDETGVTLLLRLTTHGRRCARWAVGVADIGALVTRLGGRARGHGWY